jgi:hypothetical protein
MGPKAGLDAVVFLLYLSQYMLDDRSSIPRKDNDVNFSLLHRVQTVSEDHPASYPIRTGGSYQGDKEAGA